jgi:DNA-binding response OmpR family regulator
MSPVLLLCGETRLRRELTAALVAAGYPPAWAGARPPRPAALATVATSAPPLLLVDLGAEPGDALDWCRAARRDLPAALLCAYARNADHDLETTALEQGADVVVPGPPDARRLAAQLGALLRPLAGPEPAPAADLRLDAARRVVVVAGRELRLTDAEFALLAALNRHRGRVLSRDELSHELRGRPCNAGDRALDLRVTRLRRKLGDDAHCPRWIRAIRGEGYLLLPPAT